MTTGVQFTGTVPANSTQKWFTFNWNAASHVIWTVVPTTNQTVPEVSWSVQVQRADATHCTYWISVTNLTATPVNFEGRYAILA